ncbi:MAG: hypothetical protein RJA99_4917 [Pseudomonadota bacterium]|jgi:hypothetical protein
MRPEPTALAWAASPQVAEIEHDDGPWVTLRVEPRPGAGLPDAVVLAGPWTDADVDALRRGEPAGRLRDVVLAQRHAGREHGWTVPRGALDPGDACYAVFELRARDADGGLPAGVDPRETVAAAIRGAVEGWTPPLVRARPIARWRPGALLELFAFSCQYPPGLIEAPVAHGSMHRLARCLSRPPEPGVERLTVSLGDLVYVDATAGLFEPRALGERFDAPWERLAESPEYRSMRTVAGSRFAALPDDHELHENWEPDRSLNEREVVRRHGLAAVTRHLGRAAPTVAGGGPVLRAGDATAVFLADTRLGRERRRLANVADARILDDRRANALERWLEAMAAADPLRPKVVLCPALLLPRRLTSGVDAPASAMRSDAWDGFPASMHRLFRWLVVKRIRNVVVVSGDEHVSMTARATLSMTGHEPLSVFSVHCSAMHAPYPFANGRIEDFAGEETFSLPGGHRGHAPDDDPDAVTCTVHRVCVAPIREGFARLREVRDGGRWGMKIDWFDGRDYDDAEAPYLEPDCRPRDGSRAARRAAARAAFDAKQTLALDQA